MEGSVLDWGMMGEKKGIGGEGVCGWWGAKDGSYYLIILDWVIHLKSEMWQSEKNHGTVFFLGEIWRMEGK